MAVKYTFFEAAGIAFSCGIYTYHGYWLYIPLHVHGIFLNNAKFPEAHSSKTGGSVIFTNRKYYS